MKLILVLLAFLLFTVPVYADIMTSYDVTYYLRGDVSRHHTFYGPGSYEFLWTPDYVTVYDFRPTGGQFLGFYGQAALPPGIPPISFPSGTDGAVAVPITIIDGDPPGVAVPEPPTLWLMLAALTVCAACRKARGAGEGGRSMKGLVLLAWYFAVVGGTIGPFDALFDCDGVRVQYRADTRGWTSKCWETQK